MPRTLIMTEDGSSSIEQGPGVTYHSVHGAIQESIYIFIRSGMEFLLGERSLRSEELLGGTLRVFEMGFGTGLNALLTFIEAERRQVPAFYEVVEAFPLEADVVAGLNYCVQLGRPELAAVFAQMHGVASGEVIEIGAFFRFCKTTALWPGYRLRERADLVYYDAFDPMYQPELWTEDVFAQLRSQAGPGAVLVTYCCKGSVRRALQAAGFFVKKLPGPPGKREIVRAISYANE